MSVESSSGTNKTGTAGIGQNDRKIQLKTPNGFSKQYHIVGKYRVSEAQRGIFKNLSDDMKEIKQMEIRKDDVVLVAFPKSGTHWTSDILKMLISGKADYDKSLKRNEWIEFRSFENLRELSSPRILNTHMHIHDLPDGVMNRKCKTVIVHRNPKDVCVSFYNHCSGMDDFNGTWEDFMYLFTEESLFTDWFQYTKDAWDFAKKYSFAHTMFYEDLKLNPVDELKKLATFLEVDFSDELLCKIAEKCSFDNLKKSFGQRTTGLPRQFPKLKIFRKGESFAINPVDEIKKLATFLEVDFSDELLCKIAEKCSFDNLKQSFGERTTGLPRQFPNLKIFRKGEIGDWKNWFTVAKSEKFDSVYKDKMLGCDINFTFSV